MTFKNELQRYSKGGTAEQLAAIAEVRRLGLGRFLEPVTRKVLGKNSSKELSQAAWKLAQEASKPTPETPAESKAAKARGSSHLAVR